MRDRFLHHLRDAVHIRLRSDAPFGAFLSGGLDSSAIVALMAEKVHVKTFSVGFEEAAYSELSYARKVADKFKTAHHEITIPAHAVIDHLEEATWHRGAPLSQATDIPLLLLSRMTSEHVKMVLSGEGSDEILGGYPKHRFANWPRIPHLDKLAPYVSPRLGIAFRALASDDMATWFGAFTAAEAQALLIKPLPLQRPQQPRPSNLRTMLYYDQTQWLPGNLLARGDSMTMAAGLEARMPFMDHLLHEFVRTLPDRALRNKRILRQVMRGNLPDEIIDRPKVGFKVPIEHWFRTSLRGYLDDMLLGPDARIVEILKRDGITALIKEHSEGRNLEKQLWALLALEVFLRVYKPCAS